MRQLRARPRQDVIRGGRLALPAGVASRYAAQMVSLANAMTDDTGKQVAALFRHDDVADYFAKFHAAQDGALVWAADISPASQSRILTNQLREKWEQIFGSKAKPLAETMVGQANFASASAVHSSLKEMSAGLSLNTSTITPQMTEVLKGTIAQNVSLIKSIPQEYFTKVQGEVLRSITDGKGLEDLVPWFKDQAGVTERRAKNIAIDQTHKAYNGLNRGRMVAAGIKSFQWVHSGGGLHPRLLHLDQLNGKIFRFDALPVIDDDGERGIPGQAVNCRCTMVPVVEFKADDDAA